MSGAKTLPAAKGRPLRAGAFGVGRMGQVHLENLGRLARAGEICLAAIGDSHEPTLAAALDAAPAWGSPELATGLQRFHAAEKMAAEAALDAVVIASRTEHHAADSLAFVRRGVAVLVEKPLANSVEEGLAFVRTLNEAQRRTVQVAFQRHHDSAGRLARKWVSAGWIGALQQTHHVLQDKNPTPPAYQSPGITADMAIHLVFEAMSFRGFELPRSVQALQFLAPHYEDRAHERANVVHVFCLWADGSLAHLWGSRINATGYDNSFKLIGTEGRIDVGEFAGDFGWIEAKLWRGTGRGPGPRGALAARRRFRMTPPRPQHPDFYPRYARAYARELRAFLRRVAAGRPVELGLEVGWKTLLVANAAEASARAGGRRVELVASGGRPIATLDDAARFAAEAGVP
jgi:myo-inositol 2-dehydrogenase/D-chiro-inositol 1-dehydrogenase